ncbi:MAG: DUF2330 domain-containing protein, partial [Myxococcales bacterium]|nr:DUF2330 domain-containing protein [Myxococcales bacterium]
PDTDAQQFAWVIPLQALPEFSVGSEQLFVNLLNGTVPSYQLNTQAEQCYQGGTDTGGGPSVDDGPSFEPPTGDDSPGEPEVLLAETVGAFDIVVLAGETTAGLLQWLTDNGYQPDPDAAPIFDEYLAEGHLFAAFKLTHGAGVDQIHPVVLEFDAGEACIPLRLTRIAAQEDMEVRAFFLANHRVAPRNYRHVIVNQLKIDWLNLQGVAERYKELITQAVDALKSDGHGFVTEYAGPSSAVSRLGLDDDRWDAAPLAAANPIDVVDLLTEQGVMACYADACEYYHPLVAGLLAEFLPAPDGLTPDDFYACLSCYEPMIDLLAWDASAFAAAYEQRVVAPTRRAAALLDTWPYLTRMYTTISPGEMTVDPFFHPNQELADVANVRVATSLARCNGRQIVTLPDGRVVFIPAFASWPEFTDALPYEEDVEVIMSVGAPQALVDNTALIDAALQAWNESVNAHGQFDSWDGGGGGGDAAASDDEGCGCRAQGGITGTTGALALLALLCLVRRRRT